MTVTFDAEQQRLILFTCVAVVKRFGVEGARQWWHQPVERFEGLTPNQMLNLGEVELVAEQVRLRF